MWAGSQATCKVHTFFTQELNEEERQRLCQNMAGALKGAQLFIQKCQKSEQQNKPLFLLEITEELLGNHHTVL
ncbi:hypothetical protein NQZ68_007411 [Dissostichus eleginoides]|nr:hypothetical protein NQZ68_007411 [Dissostichus eleginoides]